MDTERWQGTKDPRKPKDQGRVYHQPQVVSIKALPVEEPSAVKITAIKPQNIINSSLMAITVPGLHGESGSVTDPRLGPVQVGCVTPCPTCTIPDCLGHGAYIDLGECVFHPAYMKRCIETLRKLCHYCLRPAVLCQQNLDTQRKATAAQRRQPTLTSLWLTGCPPEPVKPNRRLCTKKQPKYRAVMREGVAAVEVVKEMNVVELWASTIRDIFAEVSEQTWMHLGMKDPSNEVFIRYLRVCPPSCRYAALVDGHLTPNRLTVLYDDVMTHRNEMDSINKQMDNIMASQDDIVLHGVHMLLDQQIDRIISHGQPSRGQPSRGQPSRGQPSRGPTVVPDAPEELNLNSEGEMEGMEEEADLDNSGDGGTVKEADEAVAFPKTPQCPEWLLPLDVDDETNLSGYREQEGTCKKKHINKEKMCHGDEVKHKDGLSVMRQEVQDVAAKVFALHLRVRRQVRIITSMVGSIVQRQMALIPGKLGILRHHLLGKRINQCARAVFTCDNSLALGVVGVPRTIATKLFQYVHIHHSNLKDYQEMLDRFPVYPCILSVIRGERHYSMKTLKNKMAKGGKVGHLVFGLQVGDVVQRHLMNGDQVVVNRQPTLAKTNMETHTVHVTNTHTISLNISITDNYSADCDGDEMNLFVPGVESHTSRLLDVAHNAVSYKNGKVSLKLKQDALRGAYTVSLRDTFFTQEEFKILMPSGSQLPPPALLKPRHLWTGLQLLSLALPATLTVDQVGTAMQLDTLVVRHGYILSGEFDKDSQDKILECCKMLFGPEVIMTSVKSLQAIAERFVDEVGGVGFSFLPEDWSCPTETLDEMQHELQDTLTRAQNIKCPQRRNAKLRQWLADQANKLVPGLAKESNVAAMLKAGSKKRPQKLVQVCLALGQHNQNDQLPPKDLDGHRILPFFSKDDTRPQAEGFVDQPLSCVGSTTADALGALVARSSCYKKHCATSESGYLQRKLGKMLEDLTLRHDGTVRDANHEIVQLVYGDDGLLPERCFTVTLQTHPLPQHVTHFYQGLIGDQSFTREQQLLLKEELSWWSNQDCLSKKVKDNHMNISVPFHLPHLMAHVVASVPARGPPPSITDIMDGRNKFFALLDDSIEKVKSDELQQRQQVWEAVVEMRRQVAAGANKANHPLGPWPRCGRGGRLPQVNVNRELEGTVQELEWNSDHRILGDPLHVLKQYVMQHVNTFTICKAAFTKHQLCALLENMTNMYQESRPAAGECVGALAAQALAEPLMQMTLNACHRAAVASDGDAIPRLTQLLNGQAEDALLELHQGGVLHAREYLVQEIHQVYAVSGESVDVRHVRLVVDYMLKDGVMSGYTRHHIPPQVSFLKAAAFERPLSVLQQAGTRARGDNLLGVSQNLILDKPVNVGANTCTTMMWVDLITDMHLTQPQPQPQQDSLSSYEDSLENLCQDRSCDSNGKDDNINTILESFLN